MDKYDLLEAMSAIRDEYIEEAGRASSRASSEDDADNMMSVVCAFKNENLGGHKDPVYEGEGDGKIPAAAPGRRRRIWRWRHWAATAAALLCLLILVPNLNPDAASVFSGLPVVGRYFRMVTFRTYRYQDEKSEAYVEEPALITGGSSGMESNSSAQGAGMNTMTKSFEEIAPESAPAFEESSAEEEAPAFEESSAEDKAPAFEESSAEEEAPAFEESSAGEADAPAIKESSKEDAPAQRFDSSKKRSTSYMAAPDSFAADSEEAAEEESCAGEESSPDDASLQAVLSAAGITEEIREMAEGYISDFEKDISEESGYRLLHFTYDTVTDSDQWFCVCVIAYTASADGYEQHKHFVINKVTGERVTLESWFGEETDYTSIISNNIREQMQEQMKEDPSVEYWIDSEEQPDLDFGLISPDQDFYFDGDGRLVICFDEGDVAPMYMGTPEFTIPREVTDPLRK